MSKTSIIHLRSSEFFGGPERAIIGQCTSMKDHAFTCVSFVRGGVRNDFLETAKKNGIDTAEIHEAFAGDFRVVKQLRRVVGERRADIVVCHDYKANFFGLRALKNGPVSQVAHFRGATTEDRKVRLYNFINKHLLRRIPLVLTVSERSGVFLQQLGVARDRIRVVPNAIENTKLVSPEFHREILTDRPVRIVTAGRLSYEKGYDVLLRAVANIHHTAPAFKVYIYGHGPEEERLKQMAHELGIVDVVEFCGFVDAILPILHDSDWLILPSRSEGMPNVLLEAWSQKLGAVSTAVGGVPEMIEHRQSGLLSPPENANVLGDQMLYALNNPERMLAYGECGYDLVRDRYNYDRQGDLLREIYHHCVSTETGSDSSNKD